MYSFCSSGLNEFEFLFDEFESNALRERLNGGSGSGSGSCVDGVVNRTEITCSVEAVSIRVSKKNLELSDPILS